MADISFWLRTTSIPLVGNINNTVLVIVAGLVIILAIAAFSNAGRRTLGQPKRSVADIFVLAVLALLAVSAVGYLLPSLGIGKTFVTGPLLLVLLLLLAVILAFRLVTGQVDLTGKGIFTMLLGLGLIVALIIAFPRIVPEFFQGGAQALQSMTVTGFQSIVLP